MIIIIWKFLTSVPYDGTAAGHCFKPSLWASETVHAYIHIPPNLRLLTSFCNVVNMYKSTNLIIDIYALYASFKLQSVNL